MVVYDEEFQAEQLFLREERDYSCNFSDKDKLYCKNQLRKDHEEGIEWGVWIKAYGIVD